MSKKLYQVDVNTTMYVWAKSAFEAENIAFRYESQESDASKDASACQLSSNTPLPEDIKNSYVWSCSDEDDGKTVGSCLEEMKKEEQTRDNGAK
jgi:hypothetical protein